MVPKALLVMLLVIVSAEVVVRYRRAQKPSNFGHSFVWQIHDYVRATNRQQADTWLIGNSTLAAGIDEAKLERLGGMDGVKMPHGSCNLAGYLALTGFYLDQAPPPRRLIVFISKDDLSSRGLRAKHTTSYIDYVGESGLRPSHWLALSFDRKELRQAAADQFDGVYSAIRGQDTAKSRRFAIHALDTAVFEPTGPLDKIYKLREVVRGWAYDEQSLRSIAETAKRAGVEEVGVVLLPCTDALAQMHDRYVPQLPYEQVRVRTRELCETIGVACLDLAVATDRYELFYDAFHVNASGRQVVTHAVGWWLAQGMPDQEPMTNDRFQALAAQVIDGGPKEPADRVLTAASPER